MASQLFKFKFLKELKESSNIIPMTKSGDFQLTMSDGIFLELRDLIYEKCGIYYTESKKYLLENRISKRLASSECKSYEDYLEILRSPDNRGEISKMLDAITINETYFFRAEQQFEVFEKIIAPEILSLKANVANPVFRIWSAACSSGEEPYTIALIIQEKLRHLYPNVQYQILASDINTSVLETAKNGIYKEYSVRNVQSNYMNKYFGQKGNLYYLSDDIKKMVKFLKINLYDPAQIKMIGNCDIILCCNVLIYFDNPSKQKVISHLYDSLNKGAYLFIGYSESLHGISKAFKLIHLPKAMTYKKE